MTLAFSKRPRQVRHEILGARQQWLSRCRRYRITRLIDYGGGPYIACHKTDKGWGIISSHRKLSAALKACQRFDNQQGA